MPPANHPNAHLERLPTMREPTPEEQASLTAGAAMWRSVAVPEAGIPACTMADGPMGVASGRVDERDVSILTPCPTALGASWDETLVARIGALVGGDAARRGIDLILAPNINLARSPLAGRAFEYFSEDPWLTGLLGAAWIRGLQSTGTGAVAKHLVCNDSETDRDRMNVVIDERTLREVYLLPFELAALCGCAGMLTAYNRVNGDWCAESRRVITDICKREWGFPGAFISDWFGTHSTVGSLAGGLDLEMPGPARFLGAKSASAVNSGAVDAARVRDAADRVAATARRFTGAKMQTLGVAETEMLLIEASAAGFTLLKNEHSLLPFIPGRDRTLAVIGPNAASPCYQGGTFAKIAAKQDVVSPIEAIRARYGTHATILFEPGVDPQPRLPSMPVAPARNIGDGAARGMTIDYFANQDISGEPLASETRDANSLVWFVGVHELGVFTAPAAIRASGLYTATDSGAHRVYLGGTGAVRMLVDGVEIVRRNEEVAASDTMGKLKRGDADEAQITLQAGQTVLIVVEFRYAIARVQGLWFGLRGPDSAQAMLSRAVDAAHAADAVILVVGETSDSSVESKDRTDTQLAAAQIRLIEAITNANPRTAIIANVGHAFDTSWDDRASALMLTWYPGQEFGPALAAVLAGDLEPGGRLPVTIAAHEADYPAFGLKPDVNGDLHYSEGTLIGYRGLNARNVAPRHAFGAGFGYARFSLTEARLTGSMSGGATVSVTLHNVSDVAGSEVVQVYREGAELTLIGFSKTRLQPGETRRVVIDLPRRCFETWRDGWHLIEHSPVFVGTSSANRQKLANILRA
jgi:beta-glucosidase